MGDRVSVAELADAMLSRERPVDVLVNNAGIIRRGPAAAHSAQDWDQVVATDLSGPFFLAQSLGRQMVQRRRGRIIFTASLLSFQGGINVISYAAAKSGLLGMTRAFANEWAPHGVNVNAVVPGYIATDVTAVLRTDPERNRAIVERIPAGHGAFPKMSPERSCSWRRRRRPTSAARPSRSTAGGYRARAAGPEPAAGIS